METSANSAGSALAENEKYLDSINGRIAVLKATWEDFSQSFLSSDMIKTAVSGLTGVLDIVSKITNTFNTPALLGGGYVAFKEIARASKGKGMFNYNPFGGMEMSGQTGIGKAVEAYKQMRTDGVSIVQAAKNTVSEWWKGTESQNKTRAAMNNMLHYQKEIDRLESYNNPAHEQQLKNTKAQLDAYTKSYPAVREYLDLQKQVAEAGGEADYSMKGLGSWASKNGKDIGNLGKQARLAAAGTQVLNIAMGALQGLAVAAAIQGITFVLGELHKALFTTAEEMETARKAAQDYGESMKSFNELESQLSQARDVYNDPTASLSDRHAAYEQISAIQSELIDKYGAEAAGLNLLTSSANEYKAAMDGIKYKEANDLLYGNGYENLEGLSKAADNVFSVRTEWAKIGWFNEDATGADKVKKDLQEIADKYKEVSFGGDANGDGTFGFKITANSEEAVEVINKLQTDVDNKLYEWKREGIDASSVFAGLTSGADVFGTAYAKFSKVLSEDGEAAESYMQARIATSEDYSNAADTIMTKEQALQDALSRTDYRSEEEKYKAVKAAMEDLSSVDVASLVGGSWGKNTKIDQYLVDMLDDAKEALGDYQFELDLQGAISGDSVDNMVSDLNKKLKAAVGDMDVATIKELWERYEMQDTKGMTADEVTAMEALRNVTKEYNVTVDSLLSSLLNAGVATGDFAALAYDSAEQLSKATAEYEKAAGAATLNTTIGNVGKNNGILDEENYKNLIAASTDFSRAIDYENGYVTLNIQKAHELAKAKAELAMSSIEEQKSMDTERYRSNMAELYNLMSQSDSALNEATRERIAELQSENEAIASNIGMYNVYMSQLKQMSSAYTAWKQTSEANNSDVTSKDMMTAIKQMKDFREKGQTGVGNVQYQMAVEMLAPDNVDDVGSYISGTLEKYFTENPIEGISTALKEAASGEGAVFKELEDGSYDVLPTASLEDFATKLHLTTDAAEALVGVMNMYSDKEIKFNDPTDISNGMNILNEYMSKRQELSKMNADDEGYAKVKEDVRSLAGELKDLPEDTLLALGIKIEDKDGNEISPSQITDEVADELSKEDGQYTIKVDGDMSGISEQMSQINEYKARIQTETDTEKVEEYNVALRAAEEEASKTVSAKLGVDVNVSDLDSLLNAYKELGGDESKQKEITFLINMVGDADVHAKISELEQQLALAENDKQHQIRIGGDTSEADTKIQGIQEKLDTLRNTEVGAKVSSESLDPLYDKAEQYLTKIDEINNRKVTPEYGESIKQDDLQAQLDLLNQLNEEIVAAGGEPVEIPIELRTDDAMPGLQQIAEEAAAGITVPIKVDPAEIGASIQAAFMASSIMYGETKIPLKVSTEDLMSSIRDSVNSITPEGKEIKLTTKVENADATTSILTLMSFATAEPITLQTEADTSGALESISSIQADAGTITLHAQVNVTEIKAAVTAALLASTVMYGEAKVKVTADTSSIIESVSNAMSAISASSGMVNIKASVDTSLAASNISSFIAANTGKIVTLRAVVDTSGASTSIAGIKDNSGTVSIKGKVTVDAKKAKSDIKAVQKAKISNKTFTIRAVGASAVLNQLRTINNTRLQDKTVTIRTVNITENRTGGSRQTGPQMAGGTNYAPGGKTLVGEIGPEMVVSKGRYYMVGQKGAEFVDLKRGDIVFNHLDTMRILADKSGVRGQALADGGVVTSGPAFSSGSINLTRALSASKTSKTSSNKKRSSTSSNKAAKSLTSSANKATEDLDKKVEELAKELSKILENFDAAVDAELKKRGNLDNIIKTYKDAQAEIRKQQAKYRSMGIADNSKYINELESQWYEYKDKIGEAIQKIYEFPVREAENAANLNKNLMKQAIRADDISKAEVHLVRAMDALLEQQQLISEEAAKLRAEGFSDNSEEVSELSLKWWDLQEDRLETQIDLYDAINERVEATSDLYQKLYETATEEGNRHNMEIAQSYILGSLQAQKNVIESQILAYRDLGYSDASKEIKELQTKWYEVSDAVDEARDKMIDALNDVVDKYSDAIDEIQDVYKTLHDAAEEYAKNGGYISVDSFQEIMKLGPKYMQYLEDENGLLTINDKNINKVIAAKTEEAAVESALTYLEQVKIALLSEDMDALNNLVSATTSATGGTWGLVYATASLLKNMGMSDGQYEDMMWNINSFRMLAESSINDLERLGENGGLTYEQMISKLKDSQDSIEDFIKYVMDMLEDRLEDQIDKLEEMEDEYKEIISLKKESLKASKEEDDYQKSIAEKVKEAAKLQGQIQILSLDDSREARAQRMKLEEQLAELQNDISDKQADYALDRQEEMLDDMSDAYSKAKEEEIEKLKETYSSKEKLYRAAVDYMSENPTTVYDEVIAWNYEQGNTLQYEIEETWIAAQNAVKEYGGTVKEVLDMIRIKIKELNEVTNGDGKNEHYDVVAKMRELDKEYTDEDSIRAILDMMEENSADWVNGEHVSSHASNKFLSNMLEKYGIISHYDDKTGEWYLDDGRRLYDVFGTGYASYASPGEVKVNEAVALEDIMQTAEAMRRNSAAWSTSKDKDALAKANEEMAKDMAKYGLILEKTKDGKWIIRSDQYNPDTAGQAFFDTYMPDGSVNIGGKTIKSNPIYREIKATVEKARESSVSRVSKFASTIADSVADVLSESVAPNAARSLLAFDTGAFGSVTPTQEFNISFGDTYITGTAEENIRAHEQVTREFTNEVLKQLNIRR